MTMSGWLKLHRSIAEHWIFSFKEPDKALAWIDLLIMARHADGTMRLKGRTVPIRRGQVGISQLSLQKKWGWSQNKVKRFLKLLENERMIVFEANDLTTMITICNFDNYQSEEALSERPDERPDERPGGRPDERRYKNDKNGKKDNTVGKKPTIPYEKIQEIYNHHCKDLIGSRVLSDKTKRNIKARWNDNEIHRNATFWNRFFGDLKKLPDYGFYRGENGNGWTANIEYLTRAEPFATIIDKYTHHGVWSRKDES